MAMRTDPKLNDPSEERSLGARLRQAREAAHMSVGQIAAALFLDPQKIEALEADAFDRFAAPAFVRGYLRGYARVLGLPSEPILEMYDRQGFDPPPLDSDAVDTMKQAHTFDIPVRLVSYAVGGVLVLLVGLWWQSQEGVGFDIGADLLGRWPDPVPETSLPSAGAPRPAPDGEEAGDDSIATAPGRGGEVFQSGGSPAPSPGEDIASGIPADAPAGSDAGGPLVVAAAPGRGGEALQSGGSPAPSPGEDTASGIPADSPAPAGSDASGPLVVAAAPGRGGEALQSGGSPAPSPGEDIASGIPADAPAPAGSDAGDPLVIAAVPGRGGEAFQSGGSPAPSPGEDTASGIPADAPAPAGSDASGPLVVAAAPGRGGEALQSGGSPAPSPGEDTSSGLPADAPAPAGSDADSRTVATDPDRAGESSPDEVLQASSSDEGSVSIGITGAGSDQADATGPGAMMAREDSATGARPELMAETDSAAEAGSGDVGRPEAPAPPGARPADPTAGPEGVSIEAAVTPPSIPETSPSETAPVPSDPGAGVTDLLESARSGLVLAFTHESWVEVYDRERTRLFFGLAQPGRVLHFEAAQPFDVLLGYGEDVRVVIDGEAFDHTPYINFGVARFSVGSAPAGDVDSEATAAEPPDPTAQDAAGSREEPPLPEDRGL